MKQRAPKSKRYAVRALPWLYGSVVVSALLAMSVAEIGFEVLVYLGLDTLLLAGFLALGEHIGLWTDPSTVLKQRSEEHPCLEPPCGEGAGA